MNRSEIQKLKEIRSSVQYTGNQQKPQNNINKKHTKKPPKNEQLKKYGFIIIGR